MSDVVQSGGVAIDGATRLLAIVGDPIAQAKSPRIYNPRIAAAGANAVLLPMQIRPDDFDTVFPAILRIGNLDGVVITFPFKERAMAYVDEIRPAARAVGAVNALRRTETGGWTGDMFDGIGLVRAVESLDQSVAGRRVLQFGAGGAGKAIAFALADAGAAAIDLVDLDRTRAETLAEQVSHLLPGCAIRAASPILTDHDLLINATTVGLAPGGGIVTWRGELTARTTVVDIVPSQRPTALLEKAAAAGCIHVGGAAMVAGQADAVLEFLGIRRRSDGPG